MTRVYPSGAAFAAASAAMVPPAPGRLSMMIFVGQRLPSSSARVRATISTAPPGGNGTRRCTGFDGKLSWASAAGLSVTHARAASAMIATRRRIEAAIDLLPHTNACHALKIIAFDIVKSALAHQRCLLDPQTAKR